MQPYVALLKNILENGHDHPDRTGTGRRSIFGTETRFNLREGFPIVTTKKTHYMAAFKELFWFISGDTNVENLNKEGVKIWDKWTPTEKDIEDVSNLFIIKEGVDPVAAKAAIMEYLQAYQKLIGPMYGHIWRHSSSGKDSVADAVIPRKVFSDLASDVVERHKTDYEHIQPKNDDGSPVSFEEYVTVMEHKHIDQLQDLILNLKRDPYSARHVVTAWLPEYIPLPGKSPGLNVLLGKGCLAPCHAMFQCFVTPNPEGKPFLSLKMFQR